MNEPPNMVENTPLEYEQKYGANYRRSVNVKCVDEFLDKIKNETKNININIIGEMSKIMQSSERMCTY